MICCAKKTPCVSCRKKPSRPRLIEATAQLKRVQQGFQASETMIPPVAPIAGPGVSAVSMSCVHVFWPGFQHLLGWGLSSNKGWGFPWSFFVCWFCVSWVVFMLPVCISMLMLYMVRRLFFYAKQGRFFSRVAVTSSSLAHAPPTLVPTIKSGRFKSAREGVLWFCVGRPLPSPFSLS